MINPLSTAILWFITGGLVGYGWVAARAAWRDRPTVVRGDDGIVRARRGTHRQTGVYLRDRSHR